MNIYLYISCSTGNIVTKTNVTEEDKDNTDFGKIRIIDITNPNNPTEWITDKWHIIERVNNDSTNN